MGIHSEDYIRLTHKGRIICESRWSGYVVDRYNCGSIDLNGHREQMNDPNSWVHSACDDWAYAGKHGYSPDDWKQRGIKAEARVAELEARIIHCNNCGSDWVDNGMNDGCSCEKIKKLVARIHELEGGE